MINISEQVKNLLAEKKDELLLTNDVAKLINKSSRMVIYLANNNKISSIKTSNGVRIFFRSDVEKLITV